MRSCVCTQAQVVHANFHGNQVFTSTTSYSTSYGAVFDILLERVEVDFVSRQCAALYAIVRPCVRPPCCFSVALTLSLPLRQVTYRPLLADVVPAAAAAAPQHCSFVLWLAGARRRTVACDRWQCLGRLQPPPCEIPFRVDRQIVGRRGRYFSCPRFRLSCVAGTSQVENKHGVRGVRRAGWPGRR